MQPIAKKKKSITIKELASIAGVSASTVSRSLNDSPLIPPETRIRIRQIANEQGFSFNAIARSLSLGRTGTIGLIFPDYFEHFSISLFFTTLQSHIRTALEKKNIDVLVSFPYNQFAYTSNIQKLVTSQKIDGMLIVNNEIDEADMNCLKGARLPYLFLHKHPENSVDPSADYYCTDHAAGGKLAAQRLLELGRKRLLIVSAVGEEFDARTEGFRQGLREAGFDDAGVDVISGDCTYEFGYRQAAKKILGSGKTPRYDGVFCQTDLMALGVLAALDHAGVRIPSDVSVIGYDDIELGSEVHPSLTTIHQPLRELAEMACDRLLEKIAEGGSGSGQVPVRCLVRPQLVVRES